MMLCTEKKDEAWPHGSLKIPQWGALEVKVLISSLWGPVLKHEVIEQSAIGGS